MSSTDRQTERDAILAAMQRLLDGAPARSTGALTVLQLAVEAGVKRWVLAHKHPDLRQEFERRRDQVNGVPAAYQGIHAKVHDLEAVNQRLRADNRELREQADTYAQDIYELGTKLHNLSTAQNTATNVLRVRCVERCPGQAGLNGEALEPSASSTAPTIGVRRVPVPVRRHHGRRPAVPAVQPVLPRRRGTADRAGCRGRPRHDLPMGATLRPAAV